MNTNLCGAVLSGNKEENNILIQEARSNINKSKDKFIDKHLVKPMQSSLNSNLEENKEKEEDVRIQSNYMHRDVSWMSFNRRILDLANSNEIPLLERLKFLSITASNLDEFVMVRMGGLLSSANDDINIGYDGLTDSQRYKSLRKNIRSFTKEQSETLIDLYKQFELKGIKIIRPEVIESKETINWLKEYYEDKIAGLITPIVFDNSRPFPLLRTKTLNIGVLIKDKRTDDNVFGTIQVPNIERVVEIKSKDVPDGERHFIFVEDIISMNLNKIFINKKIITQCYYRILRNFDDKVEVKSNVFLPEKMRESLKKREAGQTVCIEISNNKKGIAKILQKSLNVDKDFVIKTHKCVDLTFAFGLDKYLTDEDRKELVFPEFNSKPSSELIGDTSILDAIDNSDVMLHHPFDSFDAVVDFIRESANDPNVVCIKQTLYRVSNSSPIMKSLIRAAENGKQVIVLLEIKARFNEKDNLEWAAKLESAGGHVIYGVNGLKTHCKMTLVTKKTKKGNLKQYAHIGTGNYNDSTAKIYTDISLFTSSNTICKEINKLFNTLTGFSEPSLSSIISSPYHMRDKVIEMIHTEIKNKKEGKPARIIIKVNSFTDIKIIDAIYEAGEAQVPVDLIVRGACSVLIKPGQTIKVTSIVGRFLEHSRIFYFENANGKERLFIASADMMDRNLDKRFEIMVPILKKGIVKKLKTILSDYVNDNTAYELTESGEYVKRSGGIDSVQVKYTKNNSELDNVRNVSKVFIRQK